MKKAASLLSVFLVLCMVVSILAFAEKAESSVTDGTYTATTKGLASDITVNVTVENGTIVAIDTEQNESAGVGDKAVQLLTERIIENQSLGIDGISGATITTFAFKNAVADALAQSGADINEWKQRGNGRESTDEEFTYDVVVVGSGVAGLTAATRAQLQGAKVAVIEKLSIPGGTTVLAFGAFIASPAEEDESTFAQRWSERNTQILNPVNMEKLDAMAQISNDVVLMYDEAGVDYSFMGTEFFSSASEAALEDMAEIQLADAGVAPKGGEQLIDSLVKNMTSKGVDIYYDTPATKLITDGNGNLNGVECETKYGVKTFHCKSVVLATGGYSRNKELCDELAPDTTNNFTAACVGDTGDGIVLARELGAQVSSYNEVLCGALCPDPYDMPVIGQPFDSHPYDALIVNSKGARVFKEDLSPHGQEDKLINEDGADYGWAVLDEAVAARFLNLDEYLSATENGSAYIVAYKASSIEELANLMGIDPAILTETVSHYNALCEAGEDTDFGKDPQYLHALEGNTFFAVKEYDCTRGNMGGLVTDEAGAVLNNEDQPINGLYAAGVVSTGDLLGDFYAGAEGIGTGVYMGYISGESAANYAVNG